MGGRDRWRAGFGELGEDDEIKRPRRPSPGKVASTSLIGNPDPPRYPVSPGKRTLTMRLDGPHQRAAQLPVEAHGAREWPDEREHDENRVAPIQRKATGESQPDDRWVQERGRRGVGAGYGSPIPFFDQIQASFGRHDVGKIEAHVGGDAAAAASDIGARAYATGNQVAFAAPPDLHTAAHEAAHVVQQRGGVQLKGGVGRSGDAYEQHADAVADQVVQGRSAEGLLDKMAGGSSASAVAPSRERSAAIQLRPIMGPIPAATTADETPEWQKKAGSAQDYVRKHGPALIDGLRAQMSGAAFVTGMAGVEWARGGPSSFNEAFNLQFFMARSDPWSFLVTSIAPEDATRLIDHGRDAVSVPDQAQQWSSGVVFELAKVYTRRVTDSLKRIVPRYVSVWNQHVLAEEARPTDVKRKKDDPLPAAPEPQEAEVRASNPIDPYVIRSLRQNLAVDFRKVRELAPAERQAHAIEKIEKVSLAIQWKEKAINWARATPADATPEDVAAELYGSETMAYLITPAPPLFGFDTSFENKAKLKQSYRDELVKIERSNDYHGSAAPGVGANAPADQILAGPLGNEAALNQAGGIKPTPGISKAAVVERMRHIVGEFEWLQKSVVRWGQEGLLDAAKKRVDDRSRELDKAADPAAGAAWDGQTQGQLEVLGFCRNAVQMAASQEDAFKTFPSAGHLIIKLVRDYVEAAAISDLVATAKAQVMAADQKSRMFPADLMDALLDTMRPVIQAAKVEKTGAGGPVGGVDEGRYDTGGMAKKENELRFALVKVRELLLQNPEQAKAELDRLLKEITALSTEVTLVSNMDSCEAAWAALKENLSVVGEGVSVFTSDHGNDLLRSDQAAVTAMHGEWKAIYTRWKAARTPEEKKKVEGELHEKARSKEWTELFNRIGKHIKDTATLNKWVTFGVMVGIAIVTGGIGAYVEAAAGAAWGAAAGFAAATVVEAAAFSSMSYVLVEKDPSLSGFFDDVGKNILMFGALRGLGKIYVGAVGEVAAAEGAGKVGGILFQFTALNGHALYQADQEKRRKTGKGLTEDEILSISFENLAFVTAVSIGSALAKPFLTDLLLEGQLRGQLVAARRARANAFELAKVVESAKGKDPAQAHELNRALADALAKEELVLSGAAEKVKAYEAGNKSVLSEKAYAELKTAMGEHETHVLEFKRGQIANLLEPAGPNNFNVAKGSLERVIDHYTTVEKSVRVEPIGGPDPVTGARTFEITPKDGPAWRVTERVSARANELNKAPETGATTASGAELTGGRFDVPTRAEAEAAHQEALRARVEMIKRSGQLEALVMSAAVDGHVMTKVGRVVCGTGLAAAMDANTLPGAQRGADPAPLTGIPKTMGVGTGADTFAKLGENPVGQKVPGLVSEGWAVQPTALTADHASYTSAMTIADATALTQYRSGVAILDAKIVEVSIKPDLTWKVTDARVRIKVQTKSGDVFLYADATDIATGLGAPRELDLRQVNADPAKAAEYKQKLESSGRVVYGDDPSVQKGGKVLVSGGSATGAWNGQVARQLGAVVDWIGRDSGAEPQMEAAAKEYKANQDKLNAGTLSAEEAQNLVARQAELRAFDAAMLPRNLEVRDAPFSDTGIKRSVKEIKTMTPTEELSGEPPGKVKVEFSDGTTGVYDQVVCSHSTNLANPAQPGPAGALTLTMGMEMRPIVVDGMVVALETVNPPGAVRVLGAAMWSRAWVDRIVPSMQQVYSWALKNQALRAPRDSPANPLLHHVGKQIPAANESPDSGQPPER